jgi:hypothetical protein
MREVHGVSVSGSNFPAQIWGDYMSSAVSQGCGEFPDPSKRAALDPYCAKYATTRNCDDKEKDERERERKPERERERAGASEDGRGSEDSGGGSEDSGGGSEPSGGAGSEDGGSQPSRRPPSTQIDDGPPSTTSDRSARFSFSATGGDARGFECQLDGGAYRSCNSPRRYSGLERGRHTFRVRALGSGGRRDSSPASYSWRIRGGRSEKG